MNKYNLDLKRFDGMALDEMLKLFKTKQFINESYDLYNNINKSYKFYTPDYKINQIIIRKILTSYLIFYYKTDIVMVDDEISDKLFIKSRKLIFDFDKLYKENTINNFKIFEKSFNEYLKYFEYWKKRESIILSRPLIIKYFNFEKELERENTDKEKIKTILIKLEKNILLLLGKEEFNKIKINKTIPISENEPIIQQTKTAMHKAFWDILKENIQKKNENSVLILLEEIKNNLIEINPKKIDLINEHLDLKIIQNILIESKCIISKDYTINIYNFISTIISDVLETKDKQKIEKVNENIKNKKEIITEEIDYLIYTFKNIYNIMEQIRILN